MIEDCTLLLAYDDDAGQVTLEDLPVGPAGGANLVPADGIELVFDCADGRLSKVLMDAGQPGAPAAIGEPARAVAVSLLGPAAWAAVQQASAGDRMPVRVRAKPDMVAVLSRLARLDAARVISPDARSPLWAVEAAQLATRAGLGARAQAETRRAANALAGAGQTARSGMLAVAARAVADLVQAAAPELAERLRAQAAVPRSGRPAAARPERDWPAAGPDTADPPGRHGGSIDDDSDRDSGSGSGSLQWWLDPRMIPPAVFRHAVWPDAEMTVQAEDGCILVTAELAPGADRRALDGCRARLVDPGHRSVLAAARFRDVGDSRVRAEIHQPVPPGRVWVEVVGDENHPVLSEQLRHIRRAMRWADAALTATRRPAGRGAARWARLAAAAWKRCASDWSAAHDADRAYLAAARGAAIGRDGPLPAPPSAWAKELAGRPGSDQAPFLAETAD